MDHNNAANETKLIVVLYLLFDVHFLAAKMKTTMCEDARHHIIHIIPNPETKDHIVVRKRCHLARQDMAW